LIALAGILMRNTLILIGQIRDNQQLGMSPYDRLSKRLSSARVR
jgi:multidrug efflux pump subunit AcrB